MGLRSAFNRFAPRYHGWTCVAVSIFFQTISHGFINSSVTFWVIPLMTEFDGPRTGVTLAGMLPQMAAALRAPRTGAALDRWSIRWIVTAGFIAMTLGYACLAGIHTCGAVIAVYGLTMAVALALPGLLLSFAPFAADSGISGQTAALLPSRFAIFAIAGEVIFGRLADCVAHRVLIFL